MPHTFTPGFFSLRNLPTPQWCRRCRRRRPGDRPVRRSGPRSPARSPRSAPGRSTGCRTGWPSSRWACRARGGTTPSSTTAGPRARRRWADDDVGAERPQRVDLLLRLLVGGGEDAVVALDHGGDGQAHAGVARGALDDSAAGLEAAVALGVLDHLQGHAVLDRVAGVERLDLGDDLGGHRALGDAVEAHHRRVADRVEDGIADFLRHFVILPPRGPTSRPARPVQSVRRPGGRAVESGRSDTGVRGRSPCVQCRGRHQPDAVLRPQLRRSWRTSATFIPDLGITGGAAALPPRRCDPAQLWLEAG